MTTSTKFLCKSYGQKIRENNVNSFHSLCADCWWIHKDKIFENETDREIEIDRIILNNKQDLTCYICEKQIFVKCDMCHKGLCGDHTLPSRSVLWNFLCRNCTRKIFSVGCLLFPVSILVIYGIILIAAR